MTENEKSKAYDEALKKASAAHKDEDRHLKATLERIFPELKEDDDEKIKKDLIQWVDEFPDTIWRDHYKKDIIDWIEKQGEQKKQVHFPKFTFDDILALQCCMVTAKNVQEDNELYEQLNLIHNKMYDAYRLGKKVETSPILSNSSNNGKNEQTPADNVEPRFKVGDWLCANELNDYANLIKIVKIVDVFGKKRYKISRDYDSDLDLTEFDFIEKHYHLWTIQDAKDGDVLCCKSGWMCIFKSLNDHTNTFSSYCFMDSDKCFFNSDSECHTLDKEFINAYNGLIHPATKEQRDALMKAMNDADYEWNAETKTLEKLEKSSFHEGDWVVFTTSESVYQVEKKENYEYTLRHIFGGSLCLSFSDEKLIREWTIQDAKDGDVLEFEDHGRFVIGILSFVNKTTGKVDVSCLLECNKFKVGVFYNLDTVKPHPATKEQRDSLMKAMNDAGYEWDAEKKELNTKKINLKK